MIFIFIIKYKIHLQLIFFFLIHIYKNLMNIYLNLVELKFLII